MSTCCQCGQHVRDQEPKQHLTFCAKCKRMNDLTAAIERNRLEGKALQRDMERMLGIPVDRNPHWGCD